MTICVRTATTNWNWKFHQILEITKKWKWHSFGMSADFKIKAIFEQKTIAICWIKWTISNSIQITSKILQIMFISDGRHPIFNWVYFSCAIFFVDITKNGFKFWNSILFCFRLFIPLVRMKKLMFGSIFFVGFLSACKQLLILLEFIKTEENEFGPICMLTTNKRRYEYW